MLRDKNIFLARFVSSQIHEDGTVFSVQMTSCAVRYDVIYHPSPINSQFKVDRLQIVVVAKKYITTCRNRSSVGCLKCVQFHNWFHRLLVSAPLNPAIFEIRNGESWNGNGNRNRNGNGNGNGGRGTGNEERGIFKTGNL